MRRPAHRPRRSRRTKSHVVEPIYKSSLAALSTTDSAAALHSTERLRHVATHTRVQETVGTINSAAFWRPLYAALDSFAELHESSGWPICWATQWTQCVSGGKEEAAAAVEEFHSAIYLHQRKVLRVLHHLSLWAAWVAIPVQ